MFLHMMNMINNKLQTPLHFSQGKICIKFDKGPNMTQKKINLTHHSKNGKQVVFAIDH